MPRKPKNPAARQAARTWKLPFELKRLKLWYGHQSPGKSFNLVDRTTADVWPHEYYWFAWEILRRSPQFDDYLRAHRHLADPFSQDPLDGALHRDVTFVEPAVEASCPTESYDEFGMLRRLLEPSLPGAPRK
jgi:hypothetical protein